MQDPEFKKHLSFLHEEVKNFEAQYLGSYLNNVSKNPHITRLIEAFTFLHTNLHHVVDNAHASLVSSLIEFIYPHLNRPIPSVCYTEFTPSKDQISVSKIDKGSLIQMENKNQKVTFQVCYDTEIVPITIS